MEALLKNIKENKLISAVIIIVVLVLLYWWFTQKENAVGLPQMMPESFEVVQGGVTLPYGLYNNTVVYCPQSGLLYKIVNNTKRRYPLGLYKRDSANGLAPPYQTVDCQLLNSVTDGGAMN